MITEASLSTVKRKGLTVRSFFIRNLIFYLHRRNGKSKGHEGILSSVSPLLNFHFKKEKKNVNPAQDQGFPKIIIN